MSSASVGIIMPRSSIAKEVIACFDLCDRLTTKWIARMIGRQPTEIGRIMHRLQLGGIIHPSGFFEASNRKMRGQIPILWQLTPDFVAARTQ